MPWRACCLACWATPPARSADWYSASVRRLRSEPCGPVKYDRGMKTLRRRALLFGAAGAIAAFVLPRPVFADEKADTIDLPTAEGRLGARDPGDRVPGLSSLMS